MKDNNSNIVKIIIWVIVLAVSLSFMASLALRGSFRIGDIFRFHIPAFTINSTDENKDDSKEVLSEKAIDVSAISEISVHSFEYNVKVKQCKDSEARVEYISDSDGGVQLSTNGDTLEIEAKSTRKWFFNFAVSRDKTIVIYLPESYKGAFSVESASGDISIEDERSFGNVVLKTASGDADFEKMLRCEKLEVSTASGSVTASNIYAEKSINISTVSGEISIDEAEALNVTLKSTSGSISSDKKIKSDVLVSTSVSGEISLSSAAVYDVTAKTTSGEIEIGLRDNSSAKINSLSGTVRCSADLNKGYRISASSVSGEIDTDYNGIEDGGHKLVFKTGDSQENSIEINTVSGSIKIFEN